MLPDDIQDVIIAFLLLILLASVLFALQSPLGDLFGVGGLNIKSKITSEQYNSNIEENIFLLNYLKTPVELYGTKFTIADFVFMCKDDNKFEDLKEETDKILKRYNKNVDIVILCNNEKKILCGNNIEDERIGLILNGGYGVEVKMYEKSKYYATYGPQDTGGCR